jgi:hypothetical protein
VARWVDRTFGDEVGVAFGTLISDPTPPPATGPGRPKPRLRGTFTLTVYDKDLHRVGWIGSYLSLKVYPRHNAVGSAELVLPANHVQVTNLTTKGARLVIDYDGTFLMSGYVDGRVGEGPNVSATATFRLVDDFQLLFNVLGWPNPTGSITDQGAVTSYSKVSGPAESVVKRFVTLNAVNRLEVPHVRVAPDQHRGDTITVKMRMHPLAERLYPAVDQAGIGITVRQLNGSDSIVVDCYETVTHANALTEESGTVTKWGWSWDAPTASRGVLGGGGEGTDREYRLTRDATREDQWGWVREAFIDARDIGTDYEAAIKDVPEKRTDLKEASNEVDKANSKHEQALNELVRLRDALADADDAIADAQDAIDNAPATGPQHDRAVAAKARAVAAKARVGDAVQKAQTRANTHIDDAVDEVKDRQKDLDEKLKAEEKAQKAYDQAVDLRNRLRVDFNEDMVDRGKLKLAEAGSQYGFDVSLAETDTVRFGRPVNLGSRWPVEINGEVVSTETVKEVELSDTVSDGLVVTPSLGEGSSKPLKNLMRIVGNVVRKVNDRDARS